MGKTYSKSTQPAKKAQAKQRTRIQDTDIAAPKRKKAKGC
jgi:hypothetical protein